MTAVLSGDSIDATDAVRLVAEGSVWLLDVREDHEWQAGHAPAAHHVPMGALGERQDELPDDATILVICHSGARSRVVTDALRAAEYPAVNVEGGMVAWNSAGGEVVKPGSTHQR